MRTYKKTRPVDSVRLSRCFEVRSSFQNLSQTEEGHRKPGNPAAVFAQNAQLEFPFRKRRFKVSCKLLTGPIAFQPAGSAGPTSICEGESRPPRLREPASKPPINCNGLDCLRAHRLRHSPLSHKTVDDFAAENSSELWMFSYHRQNTALGLHQLHVRAAQALLAYRRRVPPIRSEGSNGTGLAVICDFALAMVFVSRMAPPSLSVALTIL